MKIGIINTTGGGMSGGYRKYLCNVIPRMALHPEVEALLCASPESLSVRGWFEQLPKVKFVNCRAFQFLHLFHDSELSQRLEEFSPDVIFVPVERFFRFKEVPVVNMIQNMEQFTVDINGNPFIERIRHRVQYLNAKRTIRRSDRVIAISKFVYDFLVTRWNIPNEQIGLVYYGIDVEGDDCRPHIIPKSWHGKFIFTAGSIRPARGLEDLLMAMKNLTSQSQNTVRLVIAGKAGLTMTGYQKKLKNWIQTQNLSSKVCWAGGLNEKEMAWCYQNCSAFVMTSRVESFGMIAGEAMAHGCICISADNPCLPEIFGGAAIYYHPKNGKALAEAIRSALDWDNNQRRQASERAKKQASKFSWDVCAEKTVAELAKAAKK